jgi:hypothetical protein
VDFAGAELVSSSCGLQLGQSPLQVVQKSQNGPFDQFPLFLLLMDIPLLSEPLDDEQDCYDKVSAGSMSFRTLDPV